MSTAVDFFSITDALESMEFQPPCDWGTEPYSGGHADHPCEDPAVWMLTRACCGNIVLACDHHLEMRKHPDRMVGTWTCMGCNKRVLISTPLSERFIRIERI